MAGVRFVSAEVVRDDMESEALTTSITGVVRLGDTLVDHGPGISTHVMLNGGMYRTQCESSGKFTIDGVPIGSYILDVSHPVVFFQSVLVEVEENKQINRGPPLTVSAYTYGPSHINPSAAAQKGGGEVSSPKKLRVPLGLAPTERIELFDKRTKPSDYVMWIIRDPKYLLMFGSLGLLIVLKFVNDSIDPDELESANRAAVQLTGGGNDCQYASPFINKVEGTTQPAHR